MSGGRSTVARKRGKDLNRQAGDISSVSPEGHSLTDRFYIECKYYRSLRVDRFILVHAGPLDTFWYETCEQAEHYGREPMLIAKQNNAPVIIVTRPGTFERLVAVPSMGWTKTDKCEVNLLEHLLSRPYRAAIKVVKTAKRGNPA